MRIGCQSCHGKTGEGKGVGFCDKEERSHICEDEMLIVQTYAVAEALQQHRAAFKSLSTLPGSVLTTRSPPRGTARIGVRANSISGNGDASLGSLSLTKGRAE